MELRTEKRFIETLLQRWGLACYHKMMSKKHYRIKIGRTTLRICSTCYQRLRAAGKIRVRAYGQKHAAPEPEAPTQKAGL